MECTQKWYTDQFCERGQINPLCEDIDPETVFCPQVGGQEDRPNMREKECALRLVNNKYCRETCEQVPHLREKLKLPAPVAKQKTFASTAQQRAVAAAMAPVGICPCGNKGMSKLQKSRRSPRYTGAMCGLCHDILRYKWLLNPNSRIERITRRDQLRIFRRKITEAAKSGHQPSKEYLETLCV